MAHHMKGLEPHHLRAAHMLANGARPSEVAAELGVNAATVSVWRADPLFVAEFNERLREARERWDEEAQASYGAAWRVLREIAEDHKNPASVRRQAASDILDRVGPVRRSQSDQHHSGSGVTITLAGPDGAMPDPDALEALEDALERELAMGGDEDP